jgi:hypothetical protein
MVSGIVPEILERSNLIYVTLERPPTVSGMLPEI